MSEEPELQQKIASIFSSITESIESTSVSLDKLQTGLSNETHPHLIESLLRETNSELPEGVSLLTLKNSSMLSYLNNLILIILANVERLEKDEEEVQAIRLNAIKNSIVQRVTMERGVKGLENRLNYQLEKMTRAYDRMIEEEKTAEKKAENGEEENEGQDKDEEDSSDYDSEEEDISSYKPDTLSLTASLKAKQNKEAKKSAKSSATDEKYKPPRITPTLPPTAYTEKGPKTTKTRKLQSMEEFLKEQSDAPLAEESIGSTILQHGRGGIKTSLDKVKESEIQAYEESNFVRLNDQTMNKKQLKRKARQQDLNVFGGEDFSMFNNRNRDISESASRKKKSMSAWDRAKRKRL